MHDNKLNVCVYVHVKNVCTFEECMTFEVNVLVKSVCKKVYGICVKHVCM